VSPWIQAQTTLVSRRRVTLGDGHEGVCKLVEDEAQEQRRDQEEDAEEEEDRIAGHGRPGLLDLDAAGTVGSGRAGPPTEVVIHSGLNAGGELLAGADEVDLGFGRDDGLKPVPQRSLRIEAGAGAIGRGAAAILPGIPGRRRGLEVGEGGPRRRPPSRRGLPRWRGALRGAG